MEASLSTIIGGRFAGQQAADDLIRRLLHVGFPADRYTSFFVNPPGHHDRYELGGDRDESPGAGTAGAGAAKGAALGGAIGVAVGVAGIPLAGPVALVAGAGVGAYVGSLAGALNQLGSSEAGPQVRVRESGVLVAVQTRSTDDEQLVIGLLREAGALDIERATGQWQAGQWSDFDAIQPPVLVGPAVAHAPSPA